MKTFKEAQRVLEEIGTTEVHIKEFIGIDEYLEDKQVTLKEAKEQSRAFELFYKDYAGGEYYEYSHNSWDDVELTTDLRDLLTFVQEVLQ